MCYDVAFGYEIDTIDGRESQCPMSSTSEDPSVSISEFPRCPTIPAPRQAPTSILVDHLNGAQNSAQVALPLGYIAAENEGSCIAFPLVGHGWGYWGTQDHASDHVANDDVTVSSPYMADLLRLYATGPSTYLQEDEVISTFGDLNHGCAEPAMRPSVCSHTSGQVIDSTAPSSGLSSPPLPLVQELRLSDGLSSDYFPLPPERIRTDMAPPAPLLCMQTIIQAHPQTPIPYPSPVLSQFNSISDDYISFGPSFLMPNQVPSSRFPQERLGYLPVHPPHTIPAGLPGLHRGSKVDLYTTGTVNKPTARILSDHPSPTPSDHGTQPFGDHVTCIFDGHTTAMIAGGVDNHGTFDKSKCNSEQVVSSRPQSSLPPNQLPPSPRGLLSRDHMSRVDGGKLSGTFRRARRFATARSRNPKRPPNARSICDRNMYQPCGWQDDNGRACGTPIRFGDCADHFAAVHDIKNITWDVKVICRWCSSKTQKKVIRKNLMRHLREVHLHCLRANETHGYERSTRANDKYVFVT